MNESTIIEQQEANRSDPALRGGLPEQFVNLVYASALRQLNNDSHAAADVTQAVFLVAMQKQRAGKLPRDERLAGWLVKVTGFCVKKAKRAAMRRSFHERQAMRSETMERESSTAEVAEVLDDALMKLGEVDREVVVRRYLHGEAVGSVATAVRLTENATHVRIGRALEKLRKILARRGVVAPAAVLTTLMVAESAKAAPAVVVAGSSAAAISIAKGATMAMKLAALKTAAAWVVMATVIGAAAIIVAQRHEEAKAVVAVNEAVKVDDVAQLARWSVILNEAGAAEVKKAGTPLATESKVYEGMTAHAATLRQVVKNTMDRNGAVRTSQDLAFAWDGQTRDNKLYFTHSYYGYWVNFDNKSDVNMMGSGGGNYDGRDDFERVAADHIRVTINRPDLKFGIHEMIRRIGNYSGEGEQAIVFSRELSAGDATAFLGRYVGPSGKVYYHLIVWEVFKAHREQMDMVSSQTDSGWWCKNGPEPLRKWSDTARLWKAQAVHGKGEVPAGFEKQLEDGKVVRLVALCRPSKWPGCWWDAQGNPVTGLSFPRIHGDPQDGLMASVAVKGEVSEFDLETPLGRIHDHRPPEYAASGHEKIDETKPLQVGVTVGPWKQVGSLYEHQSITVGDVEYRVNKVTSFGDKSFLVSFWRTGNLSNEDHVVPATVDGKTVKEMQWIKPLIYGPKPEAGTRRESPNFYGMAANDVKEFRIYQRKREWVTFEGFAKEPKVVPQMVVSEAEISHAEALTKLRADQKKLAELQAKRAQWRTIPADAKTEMGALRVLVDAIQRGDEKAVQAMFVSDQPRVAEQFAAMAHVLVVMEQARTMAVERFGELAVADQLGGKVERLEDDLMGGKWERTADGVLACHNISLRKQADGTYAICWDNDVQASEVQAMTAWAEKLKRLLEENREMTLEEFKVASSRK
ncbi:MAG: sigma-70 family RNA polymerase sigma factor [Phycisphaerales bacterium]|nr:sigma-70 family RNA polymerase sigma factor [Phycisphaerales bacterium]